MLERVDVILTHLNFCAKNTNWPPFDKVGHIVLGVKGQSCQDACSENGFLCERSFFSRINNEETLQRSVVLFHLNTVYGLDMAASTSKDWQNRLHLRCVVFKQIHTCSAVRPSLPPILDGFAPVDHLKNNKRSFVRDVEPGHFRSFNLPLLVISKNVIGFYGN